MNFGCEAPLITLAATSQLSKVLILVVLLLLLLPPMFSSSSSSSLPRRRQMACHRVGDPVLRVSSRACARWTSCPAWSAKAATSEQLSWLKFILWQISTEPDARPKVAVMFTRRKKYAAACERPMSIISSTSGREDGSKCEEGEDEATSAEVMCAYLSLSTSSLLKTRVSTQRFIAPSAILAATLLSMFRVAASSSTAAVSLRPAILRATIAGANFDWGDDGSQSTSTASCQTPSMLRSIGTVVS